uniref:Uncharacterized protein n=1 Tax=Romanomermis culicivorax TaxID=13658 RepID=A0A915I9G2_ROMCU
MAKVLSLRPGSLSLLQSKCPKRSGVAILVDGSKHPLMFSSLAILTDEILDDSVARKSAIYQVGSSCPPKIPSLPLFRESDGKILPKLFSDIE